MTKQEVTAEDVRKIIGYLFPGFDILTDDNGFLYVYTGTKDVSNQ